MAGAETQPIDLHILDDVFESALVRGVETIDQTVTNFTYQRESVGIGGLL